MRRIKDWWRRSSIGERTSLGVAFVLAVALIVTLSVQAGTASELRDDLAATNSEVEELRNESDQLTSDLEAARQELAAAQEQIEELDATVSEQRQEIEDAEGRASEVVADAAAELARVEGELREAESAREEAEELVAELLLAYSDEIEAARAAVASEAREFACTWGTDQAVQGRALNTVTGQRALSAFSGSDSFQLLQQDEQIATAIQIAETIGEEPYGVATAEMGSIATECWQEADAEINAALYVHQDVLRNAVLDAACTEGAAEVFDGFIPGYVRTAVYQDWELTLGDDAVDDYIDSISDRFGTIREFLALTNEEIRAESDRCEGSRPLIGAKGSGTYNVGEEIQPGTWQAFDVSDCYWARLAVNGDIRDNHFGDALRISVNVRSSDGQFEIEGCGFYYANP